MVEIPRSSDSDGSAIEQARELIVTEAALLDSGRFDEWLALFCEDCHYWVPLLGAAQADPLSHNSLAFEDRLLLQLRVDRLKDPRAHSQYPRSRCQHVLQRSEEEASDAQTSPQDEPRTPPSPGPVRLVLRTPFLYVESRGDTQLLLAGTARHELARRGSGWAIRQKRIDLLDASRALPAIQLFI